MLSLYDDRQQLLRYSGNRSSLRNERLKVLNLIKAQLMFVRMSKRDLKYCVVS